MSTLNNTAQTTFWQAATRLADVLDDGMLASDVATTLTCTEVDTVAEFLLAGNHRAGAQRWVEGHAFADTEDEGDLHYEVDPATYLAEHFDGGTH